MRWFWLAGLSLAAWEDLRSREVTARIIWLWFIPGMINAVMTGVWSHLAAAAVGLLMLFLSKLTRGALGEGDGLFFLMTACYLTAFETVSLFLAGLGISCIWGMAILLRTHISGRGADTIPFLTCVWLPGLYLAVCG